jgi:hypothetical protein
MKKKPKKLMLHRETVCSLQDLRLPVGAEKTIDATYCISNCPICFQTPNTNCCA